MEYQVEEIVYDDFKNSIDTLNYLLKEFNESIFIDNLGRKSIRIDRYKRDNDTLTWNYINTWYTSYDDHSIQRIEDNLRKTILSFPISFEAIWNTNEFNMDYVNNVFYTNLFQKYRINNFQFDSSITIESVTVSNSFKERAYKEVYAKGLGLVYKNVVFIDKIGMLQRGKKTIYKLVHYEP